MDEVSESGSGVGQPPGSSDPSWQKQLLVLCLESSLQHAAHQRPLLIKYVDTSEEAHDFFKDRLCLQCVLIGQL